MIAVCNGLVKYSCNPLTEAGSAKKVSGPIINEFVFMMTGDCGIYILLCERVLKWTDELILQFI